MAMNHHKPKMTKNKTLSIKNGLLSIFHFKANYFHTSKIIIEVIPVFFLGMIIQ